MKMRKIVTLRSHRYGTRQLTAGEEYELPPRHAVALVAAKRARFADQPEHGAKRAAATPTAQREVKPASPESQTKPEPSLDSLRLQAEQLGISVDGRWGMGRLQYEIDKMRHGG